MSKVIRQIQDRIESRLLPNKVVQIFGARRVGKTVLTRQIKDNFQGRVLMLNGEDDDALRLLQDKSISNYKNLLANYDLLILDEAQNVPDIGHKLKLMVDEIEGIKIIASGSSSFDLYNQTGEPLVGRASSFMLYPLSQRELAAQEDLLETRQNLESRLIYGSYPEIVGIGTNDERREYLNEMVNAYLLKDILMVDGIRNSGKMRELLRLVAYQSGNIVSHDELGRQLGLSRNTVEKYLDLLSKVFIIYRLGPFSDNLRKEVSKAGKWYFVDNGIRNSLISNFSPLSLRQDTGQLWESYLISERIKNSHYDGKNANFHFWRTYDGQEIDLIEVNEQSIKAFEFKWGNRKVRKPGAFDKAYPDVPFEIVHRDNYLKWLGL